MKSSKDVQNLLQNLERLSELAKEHPGLINPDALNRTMVEANRLMDEKESPYSPPKNNLEGLSRDDKPKMSTLKDYTLS